MLVTSHFTTVLFCFNVFTDVPHLFQSGRNRYRLLPFLAFSRHVNSPSLKCSGQCLGFDIDFPIIQS